MKKELARLTQDLLVALDAARRVLQEHFDAESIFISDLTFTAESAPADSDATQPRTINIDMVIRNPSGDGWLSLTSECVVSEKDGLWVPDSVRVMRVGNELLDVAVFHPDSVMEMGGWLIPGGGTYHLR